MSGVDIFFVFYHSVYHFSPLLFFEAPPTGRLKILLREQERSFPPGLQLEEDLVTDTCYMFCSVSFGGRKEIRGNKFTDHRLQSHDRCR